MLIRNLLTYLEQVVRLYSAFSPVASLRVITWREAAEFVEWDTETEIPQFRCEGKATVDNLTALLSRELAKGGLAWLLFISDGRWHRDELARLVQWRLSAPDLSVRVIATGYDADFRALRQIAGASEVFTPDEVVAALDSWLGADSTMSSVESQVEPPVEIGGVS